MNTKGIQIKKFWPHQREARIRLYELAYLLSIPANIAFFFLMTNLELKAPLILRVSAIAAASGALIISRVKKLTLNQAENLFCIVLGVHALQTIVNTHLNNYHINFILGALTLLSCATPFIASRTKLCLFAVLFGGIITGGSWYFIDSALPGIYFLVTSGLMIPTMSVHHTMHDHVLKHTARLNNIYNNTASGIIQVGSSGHVLQANRRFEELVEYKESELLGMNLVQICHESDKLKLKDFLFKVTGTSTQQVEIRLQTRYGKFLWARFVGGNNGTSEHTEDKIDDPILLVLDISQEKKLNELSAFQKQILTMFARKIPFSQIIAEIAKFVSIQTGGLPVSISLLRHETLKIAGSFNFPDSLLTHLKERPAEPGFGNAIEAIHKRTLSVTENISHSPHWSVFRTKNPDSPLVACWVTPIISETGTPAGVIEVFKYTEGTPNNTVLQTLDICSSLTGLAVMVHNSEELQKTYMANFTQTAKLASLGEMAAGIAHEINNPMTIIQGRAQQILNATSMQPVDITRISEVAENIVKNVQRVAKIIRGLRAFARFNGDTEFQPASLDEIILETLDLCAERFKVHAVELRFVGADKGIQVSARGTQISQVLLNLLNNAFDAVSEKLSNRWVEIKVTEKENIVQICVTDCGSGISPEISERLFQPFFTTKSVDRGTGLGLSISHGIVADHGGRIYLDRTSTNTKFVIELPKTVKSA